MSKSLRIYLLSISLALAIVLTFFTVQAFLVMHVFRPRMMVVPLSLGVVLGLLVGKVQVLRTSLAERNRLFSALADFALEFTYFRKINGEYEYVSPACKQLTGYAQED
jgi:membrane-associated PAP2 superfamily phosphatase